MSLTSDSDSDDTADTPKADSKTGSSASAKSAEKKDRRSQPLSTLDGLASTAKDYFESCKAVSDAKDSVELQRLAFERERAAKSDQLAAERLEQDRLVLDIKMQCQKRKWDHDDRVLKREEEEANRH